MEFDEFTQKLKEAQVKTYEKITFFQRQTYTTRNSIKNYNGQKKTLKKISKDKIIYFTNFKLKH